MAVSIVWHVGCMRTDNEIKVKAKLNIRKSHRLMLFVLKPLFIRIQCQTLLLYHCLCQTSIQFSLHSFILWLAFIADNYTLHSDWLVLGHYFRVMPTGWLRTCKKQDESLMRFNRLLISLERLVVTGSIARSILQVLGLSWSFSKDPTLGQ